MRLDRFLARYLEGCSRRGAHQAIVAGEVTVNGRRAVKAASLSAGDRVEVCGDLGPPRALAANPGLDLRVVYEDAAVLALDKPAGMPSHALRRTETDTVANFLLARYPEVAGVGGPPLDAGVVHRLDTDTSGVLLAARTPAAYAALRAQFQAGAVRKIYQAVVHGRVVQAGEVHRAIGPAPHNRRKMRAGERIAGGRAALTRYRPLRSLRRYTLLEVEIVTGVRHQIRVHLAAMGHPVAGDTLYGAPPIRAARHLLHACELGFRHPDGGRWITVRSAAPGDFAALLDIEAE